MKGDASGRSLHQTSCDKQGESDVLDPHNLCRRGKRSLCKPRLAAKGLRVGCSLVEEGQVLNKFHDVQHDVGTPRLQRDNEDRILEDTEGIIGFTMPAEHPSTSPALPGGESQAGHAFQYQRAQGRTYPQNGCPNNPVQPPCASLFYT